MKPVSEWTSDDILQLPIGEFDWLEVKRRRGLDTTVANVKLSHVRENLSKALTAMANTSGGQLVLGLEDPNKAGRWKLDDGGIDTSIGNGTREWLETIVTKLGQPDLRGFNVYEFRPEDGELRVENDRAIYIVDIQQSEDAPHQALDNKYYIRVGGRSRPAGHQIVLDIIGRQKHPVIDLNFEIELNEESTNPDPPFLGIPHQQDRPHSMRPTATLWVEAINKGAVYATYVVAQIDVPGELLHHTERSGDWPDIETIVRRNTQQDVVDYRSTGAISMSPVLGPARYVPVLPGLSHGWSINLDAEALDTEEEEFAISWTVCADNAPPRPGTLIPDQIKRTDKRFHLKKSDPVKV